MTEADDWLALRKRFDAFVATDLGKLYRAYDRAMIAYWRLDAADPEDVSIKRMKELDEACRAATNAFVGKLMELAGVSTARRWACRSTC
jgi:hypothetical protein